MPLDDVSVPLDLDVPWDDLGDPLDVPNVPLDDVQLDSDHSRSHHLLRTSLLQVHDRILGTHRTTSVHNHRDHAYDIVVGGEVDHAALDASLAHPGLAARTEPLHHNRHRSHCNTHHLNHCSLPARS